MNTFLANLHLKKKKYKKYISFPNIVEIPHEGVKEFWNNRFNSR